MDKSDHMDFNQWIEFKGVFNNILMEYRNIQASARASDATPCDPPHQSAPRLHAGQCSKASQC